MAIKTKQVPIKVAMVIPEMGLFEEPIKKDEISNFIIDKMYSYMKSRLVLKFFLKFKMYKIVQFFIEDKIRNKYTGHSLLAIFQKVE